MGFIAVKKFGDEFKTKEDVAMWLNVYLCPSGMTASSFDIYDTNEIGYDKISAYYELPCEAYSQMISDGLEEYIRRTIATEMVESLIPYIKFTKQERRYAVRTRGDLEVVIRKENEYGRSERLSSLFGSSPKT